MGPNTDALADALAIAQHHDAVTGTEKQHVANDYAKRLSIGYGEVHIILRPHCLSSCSFKFQIVYQAFYFSCRLKQLLHHQLPA